MADDRGNTGTSMTDQDLSLAASSVLPNAQAQGDLLTKLLASSGGGAPTMGGLTFGPQPITPSVPPTYKAPEGAFAIPQGPFGTVGERKRADKQSLFGGIAKMVSSVNQYETEKKTRQLQMSIERLMSAFEGRKEAQASGDKEAFIKNSQIINDITSDKKIRKELEKAFNISLLPNDKNNKNAAQNKAFLQAWQAYDKKRQEDPSTLNPSAEKFAESMPQRQGIDPRLQLEAQMVKAGLQPNANVALAEAGKNLRAYQTAQTAQEKLKLTESLTKDLISAKKYGVDKQYLANLDKVAGAETTARIRASAGIQEANIHVGGMLQAVDKRINGVMALADVNNKNKLELQDRKDLTAKEIANQKAKMTLQKNAIDEIGKRYRDLRAKMQQNQQLISSNEKIIKDSPSFFSAVSPINKGTDVKTWYKNRQTLAKLQQDIQEAQTQNKAINDQMTALDKKREEVMRTLAIEPLPEINTNTGSEQNPIDPTAGEGADKGSGDINVNFDLRENAGEQ